MFGAISDESVTTASDIISPAPSWSMNYIGRVTGDNFSGDFLKEALLRVPEDKPFRGPEDYTNGDSGASSGNMIER